jgi:hypothetical protein
MGSITQGAALKKQRAYSKLQPNRIGDISADTVVTLWSIPATAGAAPVFYNHTRASVFEVLDVRERHHAAGAGASVVNLRVHRAGQVASPAAAVSGTNIYEMATIPADAAINVWQKPIGPGNPTGISWAASPGNDAQGRAINPRVLKPGDTLMAITPATLAGVMVELIGIWRT